MVKRFLRWLFRRKSKVQSQRETQETPVVNLGAYELYELRRNNEDPSLDRYHPVDSGDGRYWRDGLE